MYFGKKTLEEWVEKGLLTPEQRLSILTYETAKQSKSSWGLYGISFIGVATIAIGLVSVIAGNWDQIQPSVKLLIYLLLQSALGFLLFMRLPKPGVIREAVIVLFSLAFFAGMGLTAQIYHIESKGWSALAFWCALTLPVTMLANKRLMPYLWTTALMAAFCILAIKNLEHDIGGSFDYVNATLLVFYLMFALGMVRIDRFALPDLFGEAFRTLTFLGLVIGSSALGTALWYAGHSEIYGSTRDPETMRFISNFQWSVWVGSILAIVAVLISKPRLPKKVVLPLCLSLALLAAFPTIPIFFNVGESRLVGTIFLIVAWWTLAVLAIQLGRKRTFDFITLAITVRVLVVYFEVFGNMLQTGVGLIVSGSLVLGLAAAWYKLRDRLVKWIGVA